APLLFAIVNGAVQMNRLSERSKQLVVNGVQGTRSNQRMFEELGALERSARLYQIIGNREMLDVYARNQERLNSTVNEMLALPIDEPTRTQLHELLLSVDRLQLELKQAAPNSPHMADLINSFPTLSDQASKVSERISQQIDNELTDLQRATQHAQQNLAWQTLL